MTYFLHFLFLLNSEKILFLFSRNYINLFKVSIYLQHAQQYIKNWGKQYIQVYVSQNPVQGADDKLGQFLSQDI